MSIISSTCSIVNISGGQSAIVEPATGRTINPFSSQHWVHDRHKHWPRWFQQQGITDRQARQNVYMHYSFQALIAVREGAGVVLADYFEASHDLASGKLVKLFDTSITYEESVYLIHLPENRLSMRARLCIDFLQAWLKSIDV